MENICRQSIAKKTLKTLLILALFSFSLILIQFNLMKDLEFDMNSQQKIEHKYSNIEENNSQIMAEQYDAVDLSVENEKSKTKTVQAATVNTLENKKIEKIQRLTGLDAETSRIIVEYTNKYDIPSSLLLAVIDVESNFNQYEVGEAADRGYCQIIPGTEKWLIENLGKELGFKYQPENIFDPEYNIGLCVLYLNHLIKSYNANYHRVLSEYNRGPYNLAEYYKKHNTYVTSYSKTILSRRQKYIEIDKI